VKDDISRAQLRRPVEHHGKRGDVVCTTGMATRNRLPSLVGSSVENQAAGIRKRNWGLPGPNVAPADTATDINVPSGEL
jgi:hypothetical protein